MTKEELAKTIYGRQCDVGISKSDCEIAEENGLVIVYGYSDDLMEIEGGICDEIDCYHGGTAYFNETELWVDMYTDDYRVYAEKEREKCKTIEAVWHDNGNPCWTYETDIPHAKFNLFEDDELYCVGIVFEMASLRNNSNRTPTTNFEKMTQSPETLRSYLRIYPWLQKYHSDVCWQYCAFVYGDNSVVSRECCTKGCEIGNIEWLKQKIIND